MYRIIIPCFLSISVVSSFFLNFFFPSFLVFSYFSYFYIFRQGPSCVKLRPDNRSGRLWGWILCLGPGRWGDAWLWGSLVDSGSNLAGARIVWKELLLKLCYTVPIITIETLLYCANIIRKYTRPCGTHCNKQTNDVICKKTGDTKVRKWRKRY
jgi:hypothetical protein